MTSAIARHLLVVVIVAAIAASVVTARAGEGEELLAQAESYRRLVARFYDREPSRPVQEPSRSVATVPYLAEIERAALRHQIPIPLIQSVIFCESSFDSKAVSRKGAIGLMQLMPATAIGTFGVHPDRLFTPAVNIDTGTAYLRLLANRYRGQTNKVLGAYNAGPSRVDSGKRLPQETIAYIRCVGMAYSRYAARATGNKEGAIQ